MALYELTLDTAPMLLVGLAAGAALQTWGARIPSRLLAPSGPLRDALRGALVGAPLPLCSCSVLPVSNALAMRRASPALIVAFLLATPELGVETFALSVRFLGWPFAWMRLGGALFVAIVAALTVAAVVRRRSAPDSAAPASFVLEQSQEGPAWKRFVGAFDELLFHIGAWMVLGLVAAAFVEALVPDGAFANLSNVWLQLLAVTIVTVPSYICAPSATPLAAVLIAKGLSPGAALLALLLGPATNVATLIFLRSRFGGVAAAAGIAAVVVSSWLIAFATNAWVPISELHVHEAVHAHDYGWITYGACAVLGAFLLRSVWLAGARGWVAALWPNGHGHGGHAHGHGHGGH